MNSGLEFWTLHSGRMQGNAPPCQLSLWLTVARLAMPRLTMPRLSHASVVGMSVHNYSLPEAAQEASDLFEVEWQSSTNINMSAWTEEAVVYQVCPHL